MQKFNGSLIRQFPSLVTGNAATGVQVTVKIAGSNTLATLYATNNTAGATKPNPTTTDGKGFYSFYAADGQYVLEFNNGFPSLEIQLLDAVQAVSEIGAGSGLVGQAASAALQSIAQDQQDVDNLTALALPAIQNALDTATEAAAQIPDAIKLIGGDWQFYTDITTIPTAGLVAGNRATDLDSGLQYQWAFYEGTSVGFWTPFLAGWGAPSHQNLPGRNGPSRHVAADIDMGGGLSLGDFAGNLRSVIELGADPLGVSDSTLAFTQAAATGLEFRVPAGVYRVSNIPIADKMNLRGDGSGSVTLLVTQNNSGAFYSAGTSLNADIKIRGMTIRAADGVTGARAIYQSSKQQYIAYADFTDLETWVDLRHSYDALFIFTSWTKCRDGYSGTAPAGQAHSMIKSVPDAYGQVNQLNLNQMHKCQMFRSNDPDGCLHIEYGSVFSMYDCDFEQLDCRAINARGILQMSLTNTWFEYIRSAQIITLANSPAPNALGCRAVQISGGNVLCDVTNETFVQIGGNSNASIENVVFAAVPANMTLTTLKAPTSHEGVQILSGSPTNFFSLRPTVLANNVIDNSATPSAYMSSIKVNPSQVGNLTLADFSASTAGVPAPNLTAVSSAIGSGNAIRMTLSDGLSAAWYSVPAKLVNKLRGLDATVSVCGYAEAGFNENITAAVWVDIVNPTGSNSTAAGGAALANTTDLVISNHTFTVPIGATTIKIGFITGGNAQGQDFNIESVDLLTGRANPLFPAQ